MKASIDPVKEVLFDAIDPDEKPTDVDSLKDESIDLLQKYYAIAFFASARPKRKVRFLRDLSKRKTRII